MALTLLAAACTTPPACPPVVAGAADASADTVYVAAHGWHVELGVAADRLHGPLAAFRDVFPGARSIMFGYGKRTFMSAPPETVSEYFLGPLPGPAVIQVSGLNVMPPDAYDPGQTVALTLPPGGFDALQNFIWNDLGKDKAGGPRLIAVAPSHPGALLYAAQSRYDLFHTCNTWAVDGLAAAGLPISSQAVVFSGQAMGRAEAVEAGQCGAAGAVTPGRAQ